MENENNDRKILILCALGAVCVIIVAIIVLIGIWTPDKKTEAQEQKADLSLGKYENIYVDDKEQVNQYIDKITTYLATKNLDKLYEMLNPEYVEYFNVSKEKLKKDLVEKGLYGTVLTSNKYNLSTLNSNRYITANLNSNTKGYVQDLVNIIEYSPNDYKIAFDNFVMYNKVPQEYIRNKLNIKVNEQVAFNSKYIIKMSITNNTDDVVYFNPNRAYDFIYLVSSTQGNVPLAVHLYSRETVSIDNGKTLNLNMEFNIDEMSVNNIKGILIKEVKIGKTGELVDIQLDY